MSTRSAVSSSALAAAGEKHIAYDPNKSNVSVEQMNVWLSCPLTNMSHVPGLGEKSHNAFTEAGINGVFPLIGKFLSFRDINSTSESCCQNFFDWMGEVNLPHGGCAKHAITRAVAEKVNLIMPGVYDRTRYPQQQQQSSSQQQQSRT